MTAAPDITRTWAGVAEAERIGYNGELLTPAEIQRREEQNADAIELAAARELRDMSDDARDRRIRSLRDAWGDARTDAYLARLRDRLREGTEVSA